MRLRRLLDGPHRWGSIEVRPDRFGLTRHRLVVYPPGLTDTDRRWIRAARGYPVWGFAVWLAAALVAYARLEQGPAFLVATAVYLAAGAAVLHLAGPARRQVRTLEAVSAPQDPASTRRSRERIDALAAALGRADEQLDAGIIGAAEHERIWWWVYEQLSPTPPQRTR